MAEIKVERFELEDFVLFGKVGHMCPSSVIIDTKQHIVLLALSKKGLVKKDYDLATGDAVYYSRTDNGQELYLTALAEIEAIINKYFQ